ncbi:hypothetical protein [uncultured Porphyromonas sp.]|uniref:hypothetical protein n=1 Tax=uncultured Porphyromonas sp. TaxID=159274 RepID=UPI002610F1D9|nr:hypothetical protein [uncultured Porphyromonas sp.]
MKKILYLLCISSLLLALSGCKSTANYGYELHSLAVGSQGSSLVKVYSYGRTQDKAIQQAKRDAVHGILFKGVPGGAGVSQQPALVKPNEQAEHESFFKKFFDSGEYLRFVSLSSDGTVSAQDRLKVGNMYKVGVAVSVQKDALRKYLEEQGVIKKLDFLF